MREGYIAGDTLHSAGSFGSGGIAARKGAEVDETNLTAAVVGVTSHCQGQVRANPPCASFVTHDITYMADPDVRCDVGLGGR